MVNITRKWQLLTRPRVMFIIDNPYRELWGISAVSACLREQGISSVIASKANYPWYWEYYRPEAVVFPRVTNEMADFVRSIAERSWIFLIPSEHGNGFRDKVLANIAARRPDGGSVGDSAVAYVDMAFLGGNNQYEWLREEKILDERQMQITGTLNSDHWCLAREKKKSQRTKSRIGIATTNKSILFGMPVRSVVGLLDLHRSGHWEESLWRVDFATYELAHTLLLTEVIEGLRQTGWNVSLRPHPHEYVAQWRRYVRMIGSGVELNRTLRVDEWLDTVSVVLASFSTVSIDAIAHGIPSLTIHALLPERVLNTLPAAKKPFLAPYAWSPKSLDEFFELVEKARRGALAPSPEPELAYKFMDENFNFPRDFLACEAIAQTVARMIRRSKGVVQKRSTGDGRETRGVRPLRVLCRIPGIGLLVILMSYLRTLLLHERRGNLYFPFSLKQSRSARRYVLRVVEHLRSRGVVAANTATEGELEGR